MSEKITDDKNVSFIDTVKSVAAAFIGVQSSQNREKDFKQGKISHFIIVGVVFVVLFIVALVMIVNMVLPSN